MSVSETVRQTTIDTVNAELVDNDVTDDDDDVILSDDDDDGGVAAGYVTYYVSAAHSYLRLSDHGALTCASEIVFLFLHTGQPISFQPVPLRRIKNREAYRVKMCNVYNK